MLASLPFLLSRKKLAKKSVIKLILIGALALFVIISALPLYSAGWPWASPPKLPAPTRTALQAIPTQGIEIPGWVTDDQIETKIGGHKWSVQQLSANAGQPNDEGSKIPTNTPIFLLLRPQIYEADQPEVEWLDIKGSQHWSIDSRQSIFFDLPINHPEKSQTVRIKADFFRAWNEGQTYAVLQWYAWATGGSASPAQWFWADQTTQWLNYQRMPWVAVSLWLPIAPFGDIVSRKPLAESLGQNLQQALSQSVFLDRSKDTATK